MSDLAIEFPRTTISHGERADFSPFLDRGIDCLVLNACRAISESLRDDHLSPTTLMNVSDILRIDLFPWLIAARQVVGRDLLLSDIDRALLEEYVADLKQRYNYSTAANRFAQCVTGLRLLANQRLIAPISEIRPVNPFPGSSAAVKARRPYSKRERTTLLNALSTDLNLIRNGSFKTSLPAEPAIVYLLLMAFRSGFNLSPLLLVSRTRGLRPHPVRKQSMLMVSYKERAKKEVTATVHWSDEVAAMGVVGTELVVLFEEMRTLTAPLAESVAGPYADLLFLRPPLGPRSRDKSGLAVPITSNDLAVAVHKGIAGRHNLVADNGERLVLNVSRIRATLADRVFELSGGDPLVVARILGNRPKTTDIHYLEPPPGSEAKFASAVGDLMKRLKDPPSRERVPTPVSGCSDPLYGRYAPKDGVRYCERWLNCFRCPNQCITGEADELWRIYSFYWVLQENGKKLRQLPISGLFRFVIRIIDTVMPDRYGEAALKAKARARSELHPFWAIARAEGLLDLEVPDALS